MYIYNTTYVVTESVFTTWNSWVRAMHIPQMLEQGFTEPQIAKVITNESEQEGVSITVQFKVKDLVTLNSWAEKNLGAIRSEIKQKFGENVLPFDTILEILDKN